MSPAAKNGASWIMRGVVSAIVLAGAGLVGSLFGHTGLEAHPVAAEKLKKIEAGYGKLSGKVDEIGDTMTDVRIQQAEIKPLLEAVQRSLDDG